MNSKFSFRDSEVAMNLMLNLILIKAICKKEEKITANGSIKNILATQFKLADRENWSQRKRKPTNENMSAEVWEFRLL